MMYKRKFILCYRMEVHKMPSYFPELTCPRNTFMDDVGDIEAMDVT